MKCFRAVLSLAIGIVAVANSHSAIGQTTAISQGAISGSGVAIVKRQPDVMRMRLEVTASGKDLADALAKLKTRREAALKVCSDLGAAPATLNAGASHMAAENSQQQQVMAQLRRRARGSGRSAKKAEAPPVNVASTLTAVWPLKGSDGDELLLASQTLQGKIKSELAKSMPKEELSPEEEELREEAAQEMVNYGNTGPKQGEPLFYYAAKISKDDYTKAAAKAFAMAKAHAQRLADAAGIPLGSLRSVEGNDRQAIEMMNYASRRYYNGAQDDESADPDISAEDEAIGTSPTEVRLTIAVGASFTLGK